MTRLQSVSAGARVVVSVSVWSLDFSGSSKNISAPVEGFWRRKVRRRVGPGSFLLRCELCVRNCDNRKQAASRGDQSQRDTSPVWGAVSGSKHTCEGHTGEKLQWIRSEQLVNQMFWVQLRVSRQILSFFFTLSRCRTNIFTFVMLESDTLASLAFLRGAERPVNANGAKDAKDGRQWFPLQPPSDVLMPYNRKWTECWPNVSFGMFLFFQSLILSLLSVKTSLWRY